MRRFGSKTVIITGASRGIGRAIAVELSCSGMYDTIILVARTEQGLVETKNMMVTDNVDVLIEVVDLENYSNIVRMVEGIKQRYKSIDTLVNVAGYANPKSLLEMDTESLEKTFRVNVMSMFVLTREVVRVMKNTGGKILNIASTSGLSPRPGWSAYAASKAAVINFSSTLSSELEEYGIKVYCLSPGRCATELRRVLAPDEDPSTIMQPEEVAAVVSTLLGPNGDCLDGQNIVIRRQLNSLNREASEGLKQAASSSE